MEQKLHGNMVNVNNKEISGCKTYDNEDQNELKMKLKTYGYMIIR